MAGELTAAILALRRDLQDLDAAAYQWTDAELQRYIERSVAEFSAVAPELIPVDVVATDGQRVFDLYNMTAPSTVAGGPVEVEWPYVAEAWPRNLVPFTVRGLSLYLLTSAAAAAGDIVRVWLTVQQLLTDAGMTLPPAELEVVLLGAAGYACLAAGAGAVEAVRMPEESAEQWRKVGYQFLDRFRTALAQRRRGLGYTIGVVERWETRGV